jgi:hypothetical protein
VCNNPSDSSQQLTVILDNAIKGREASYEQLLKEKMNVTTAVQIDPAHLTGLMMLLDKSPSNRAYSELAQFVNSYIDQKNELHELSQRAATDVIAALWYIIAHIGAENLNMGSHYKKLRIWDAMIDKSNILAFDPLALQRKLFRCANKKAS